MHRAVGSMIGFLILFIALSLPARGAAFEILRDTDLPGSDYRSGFEEAGLKGIKLSQCHAACAADQRCVAFTYNTRARVCFLKEAASAPQSFAGAVSGRRVASETVDHAKPLRDRVARMVADYRPESVTVDIPSSGALAQAAARLRAEWERQPPAPPLETLLPGLRTGKTEYGFVRLFASDEHEAILRLIYVTEQDLRQLVNRLEAEIERVKGALGARHPIIGNLLTDYSELLERIEPGVSTKLQREVLELMAGPLNARDDVRKAFYDRRRGVLALDAERCDDRTLSGKAEDLSDEERSALIEQLWEAAVIDHAALGPRPAQIELLRSARRCVESGADEAVRLAHEALILAEQLGESGERVSASFEYAQAAWAKGDHKTARDHFRRAVAMTREMQADGYDELLSYASALAELGLQDELNYVAALDAISIYAHTETSVGQWASISVAVGLEKFGLFDLADDYYAAVAGDASSPVSVMLAHGSSLLGMNELSSARLFPSRALKQLESRDRSDLRVEALTLLARIDSQAGNLAESGRHAEEALRLARLSPESIDDPTRKQLDSIIREAAIGSGATDQALAGLSTGLEATLAEYCRTIPDNDGYFPGMNLSLVANDMALTEAFAAHPLTEELLECFDRQRDRMVTAGGFWEVFADIFFIHTVRGDQTAARSELEKIFSLEHKSDRHFLEIVGTSYDGLLRGGHPEWIRPFLPEMAERVQGRRLEALTEDRYNDLALGSVGFIMLAEGDPDTAQRLRDAMAPTPISSRAVAAQSCHDVDACDFLAVMAERAGREAEAGYYRDIIPNRFHSEYAGASYSPWQYSENRALALDKANRFVRLGHYTLAEIYYDIATELSRTDDSDPLASATDLQSLASRSTLLARRGDVDGSRRITSRIVGSVREKADQDATFGSDVVLRWAHRLYQAFNTHLSTTPVAPNGDLVADDDGFIATQFLQTTRTATSFMKLSARMGLNAGDLARRHQDLGRDLSNAYGRLAQAADEAAKALALEIETLEAERAQIANELQEKEPAYFQNARLHFPHLTETQAHLGPNEALLSAYVGEEALYLWFITGDAVRLKRVNVSRQALSDRIALYRAPIKAATQVGEVGAMPPLQVALAYELFELLLGPFRTELASVDHLIFVPNGPLDGLPLGALLTQKLDRATMPAEALRDARLAWLIRDMAIAVVPSVSALKTLRSADAGSLAPLPFFGIGDPDFRNEIQLASLEMVRSTQDIRVPVPPLPETADEVRRIAAALGADPERDLLLGADVTEERIRQLPLNQYRVIDFATHGVFAGEIPGVNEPALVLSIPEQIEGTDDGLLTAEEITALKLDADLVILSACNTAASDGRPGAEGLSGLASAFFYAGARNLMVTHWHIPSAPAVELTSGMIERQSQDPSLSWAEALRQSALALIDDSGPAHYAHPANWAGQFMVGAAPAGR